MTDINNVHKCVILTDLCILLFNIVLFNIICFQVWIVIVLWKYWYMHSYIHVCTLQSQVQLSAHENNCFAGKSCILSLSWADNISENVRYNVIFPYTVIYNVKMWIAKPDFMFVSGVTFSTCKYLFYWTARCLII